MSRLRCATLSLLLLAAAASLARAAEAPACFPAADLAAKPGEEVPRPVSQKVVKVPAYHFSKPVEPTLRGVVRRVSLPAGKKVVALTFDLCETSAEIAGYDGAIVDTLRREKVAATFFAGGHGLATHPERARQLEGDPLFEVGNHSWSHKLLTGVDQVTLATQVLAPQGQAAAVLADVKKMCPKADASAPTLFRFPAGICDKRALDFVNDNGLLAIEWDVVTGDPDSNQQAKAIEQVVLAKAKPGSIIIMHANGRGHHTAEALPAVIEGLKRKGYSFATISDLLAMGTPEIVDHCTSDKIPEKKRSAPKVQAGTPPAGTSASASNAKPTAAPVTTQKTKPVVGKAQPKQAAVPQSQGQAQPQ